MRSIVAACIRSALACTETLAGEPVVFTRGDNISIEMPRIVQGRSVWKGVQKGGGVVVSESADFFVPAELLVWEGERLKPKAGDKFTVTTLTLASVYDVQPFGKDRICYRWHDRSERTVRRVFTSLFSEDPI